MYCSVLCVELKEMLSHACFSRSYEASIHLAARGGHFSCLEWLLTKNADVMTATIVMLIARNICFFWCDFG